MPYKTIIFELLQAIPVPHEEHGRGPMLGQQSRTDRPQRTSITDAQRHVADLPGSRA